MKVSYAMSFWVALSAFCFTCGDRDPINPLDSDNPKTDGTAYTLSANSIGIGKIKLHWKKVNQPQVKGYKLYRSDLSGARIAIAAVADTLFFDTFLQPNTIYSYYYRLIWEKKGELHQSPAVGIRTFDAPTGLNITRVTRDRIEIKWDDPSWLDNFAYCRIYRSTGSAFSVYDSTTANQHVDNGVTQGVTYHYKVVAVATDGCQSNASSEITAMPGNSAPPVINSLQLSQPITGWGETVAITCFAQDADGDTIFYHWQALDGGSHSGSGKAIAFQSPLDDLLNHRVMVTVYDSYSTGDSDTISVISAKVDFSENFDSYPIGAFPSGGWRLVWNGAGNSYQVVTNAVSSSPPNSMQMKGTGSWSANMDHAVTAGQKVIWFEVKMRISDLGDGGVSLWNRDETSWGKRYCAVEFVTDGNIRIGYYDGVWYYKTIASYVANRWYKIKVKYNALLGSASVWIDDALKVENHQVLKGGQGYRQIMLSGGWNGKLLDYDDLKVWIQ